MDGQREIFHTGYERLWKNTEVMLRNSLKFGSVFDTDELESRVQRLKRKGGSPLVYWKVQAKG
ncbi:MAG: hypothetical protein ACI9JM_002715 [Halioglobus sp.]|jgi:hypothetical protein